jgi:hypothetical protein
MLPPVARKQPGLAFPQRGLVGRPADEICKVFDVVMLSPHLLDLLREWWLAAPSWVRHGPLIAAASGPPIIQAVLWAGTLLAS